MKTALARRLGFASIAIYAIGDVLGAGIYALAGKVIDVAGPGAWLTFILSALMALTTGLSYAEMSARFPVAAGAAAFVRRAFPGHLIATVAGIFVLGTSLASAATISVAFSDYLEQLVSIPKIIPQLGLVTVLSFLSFWGIHESSRVNMVFTAVEVAGLFTVIITGLVLMNGSDLSAFANATHDMRVTPVLTGITVAFFAYIGFEDVCSLAEESKNPSKDIPRAILVAIAASTVMYLLVVLMLQINLSDKEVAASPMPFLLLFEKAGLQWIFPIFIFIAMMAVTNTGLTNLITGSRLLYGMANEKLIHPSFGKVHHQRKTPWVGVLVAYSMTVGLILTGSLKILAQTTSLLVALVFLLVHASLILVKWKHPKTTGIRIPFFVPCLGVAFSIGLMFFYPPEVFLRASIVLGLGLVVWLVKRFHFFKNDKT